MAMRPALLAGLAVLLASASAEAAPRVSEFSAPVAAGGATARAAAATIAPGRRFDLVGLRWRGHGTLTGAKLRTRSHGRWRPWVAVETADGAAHGTDPIWVDGADALQLRYRSAPRGLRLHFVRITRRVRPSAPWARMAQASAPPSMVMRSQWDPGGACKPRAAPSYGEVNLAFVHHTVSENDYSAADSPSIVLAICRFHRNDNGWNDIGYNFLVDRYGRLFEGRAGGIDKPVIGAQAEGWNSVSTSVSNIGTFTDEPETDAAIGAMSELLAWKLPLHGVPVTGPVTLTSRGGATNRWKAGTKVTFQRISGHRDGSATACPGDDLYAQLPELRALAAQRAGGSGSAPVPTPPGSVTLDALSTALVYPEPARLTGSLTGGGEIWVQVAAGRSYRTVAKTFPQSDGSWALELPLARSYALRALQVLPDGTHGAASSIVAVGLAPSVQASAPRRVLANRSVPVRGTIAPAQRWVTASIAIQDRRGRFHYVRRAGIRVARSGRFAGKVAVGRAGVYRVSVSFAGTRFARPSAARPLYLRAVSSRSKLTGGSAVRAG
jgi:hypothetical protein